eukprot:CAMPEP_0196801320 /NCGR_PEP_ID=MMETSP1362-20130617/1075_1 /TAXON_ID=163516 /ORGANISM="Leptocylindrus danicus, Strain CCMP1856" /LENGTH=363 /DNA_ID=CAMNT_0042172221 /DNA_START=1 /DNA_END=1092 /DNA_ORIENTATION=+
MKTTTALLHLLLLPNPAVAFSPARHSRLFQNAAAEARPVTTESSNHGRPTSFITTPLRTLKTRQHAVSIDTSALVQLSVLLGTGLTVFNTMSMSNSNSSMEAVDSEEDEAVALTAIDEETADVIAEAMEEVLEEQGSAEETLAYLAGDTSIHIDMDQPLVEEEEASIIDAMEEEEEEVVDDNDLEYTRSQTFQISAADIEAIEREAEEAQRIEAEEIARAAAVELQRKQDMEAARKLAAQKQAAARQAEEERQEALARAAAVEEQRKADMEVARKLAAQKKEEDAALAVLSSSATAQKKSPSPPKEPKEVPTSLQKKGSSSIMSVFKSVFGVVRQKVLPLVLVSFVVAAVTKLVRFYIVGSVA